MMAETCSTEGDLRKTSVSKILVIEDEPSVRMVLRVLLQWAGHEVQVASNGEDGLKQLQTGSPDLLITDLCLPTIQGDEDPASKANPSAGEVHRHVRRSRSACGEHSEHD